jgi:hypothetical protein
LVRQVSATFETGNVRKCQVTPFGDHSLNGSNGEGFRCRQAHENLHHVGQRHTAVDFPKADKAFRNLAAAGGLAPQLNRLLRQLAGELSTWLAGNDSFLCGPARMRSGRKSARKAALFRSAQGR